jgi:DNA gyrase subunit A
MGVFDMDIEPSDHPSAIGILDEGETALIFTNRARVFRLPVRHFSNTPLRGRGDLAFERSGFEENEFVSSILPVQARGYVALLGEFGKVRLLRHHLFGEHMKPGTVLFNYSDFGPLTSACWTPGDAELFIVTASGMAIRFAEKAVSPQGETGIRLGANDRAVGITSVKDDSSVLIIGADGRGALRQMSGFAPNKSAGGSGKIAIKNSKVIGAMAVNLEDEVFLTTRLSKVIRFKIDEIPPSEGPVQGVNVMALRSDELTAFSCDARD